MNKRCIKTVGYAAAILCVLFVVRAAFKLDIDWSAMASPEKTVSFFVLFSVVIVLCVYLSAFAWKMILEFVHGEKIERRQVLDAYVRSNIYKYLPGNMMHFAGRNILVGKLGFKQLDIAFCTLMEIGMLVMSACVFSMAVAGRQLFELVFQFIDMEAAAKYITAGIVLLVLLLGLALFLLSRKNMLERFRKYITFGFAKLAGKLFVINVATQILPGILLSLIFTVIFGLSFTFSSFCLCIAAYTVSWTVGFIVPGAPGGLGVRESILILLLGPVFGNDFTVLASVYLRAVNIIGDVLSYLLQLFFNYRNKNSVQGGSGE